MGAVCKKPYPDYTFNIIFYNLIFPMGYTFYVLWFFVVYRIKGMYLHGKVLTSVTYIGSEGSVYVSCNTFIVSMVLKTTCISNVVSNSTDMFSKTLFCFLC